MTASTVWSAEVEGVGKGALLDLLEETPIAPLEAIRGEREEGGGLEGEM